MTAYSIRQRRSLASPLGIMLILVLIGVVLFGYSAVNASQETEVVLVAPSDAHPGELLTVKVVARNVRNLGAFQSTVRFDPSQLRLTGATIAEDLKRSGRDVMEMGPVLRDDAAVIGAITCPIGRCGDAKPGISLRQLLAGVGGEVELGTISFYAAAPGSYQLSLEQVQLADSQGNVLSAQSVNTTLVVQAR